MRKILLSLLLLLFAGAAGAQTLVNCATNTPCTINGPVNTHTGDAPYVAFGKVNTDLLQLWPMFGASGLLRGNGAIPNPMTSATYADVAALFLDCNSTTPLLGYDGQCHAGGGSGSMTWPSAAGIPCYSSDAWCTSYSSSNPIPADFLAATVAQTNATNSWTELQTYTVGVDIGNSEFVSFLNAAGSADAKIEEGPADYLNQYIGSGGWVLYSDTGTDLLDYSLTNSAAFTVLKPLYLPDVASGTLTDCLGLTSAGLVAYSSGACGSGGSPAFSAVTSATNTTAAMLVGTGASLGPTGTGTVNANEVNGATVPASAPFTYTGSSGQLLSGTAGNGLSCSSGTCSSSYTIRTATGSTDTILSTDCANGVYYDYSGSVAVTLPQATGSFAGCSVDIWTASGTTVTVTPTTSTINGGSSLPVDPTLWAQVVAQSGNYLAYGTATAPTGGGYSGAANEVVATPNGSSGSALVRALVNADFPASGATAGSYTCASVTVNAQGIVTGISTGSCTGSGAQLNVAQTWSAAQTFPSSDILIQGSSTGTTAIASANSGATNYVATLPANTGTIAETNVSQTWGSSTAQTFPSSVAVIGGSSGGGSALKSLQSSTVANVSFPASSGQVVLLGIESVTLTSAYTNATTGYTSILALPSVSASAVLRGSCDITWEGSSTSITPTFAIGLSATPTDLWSTASYAGGAFIAPTYTTIASTTTTAITGALATTAASTAYLVHLSFTIENSTTANTVTIYGESSSTSYTLTVEPGSSCGWLP